MQIEIEFSEKKKQLNRVKPFVHFLPNAPKPTQGYQTYWMFAAKRQEVFFRKMHQSLPPWTDDPILKIYKFTNTYRASDRVSQYLIQNVIYHGDQSPTEIFFRILLFKIFNKIETWKLLEFELGQISYAEYSFQKYDTILKKAMLNKKAIYSSAYIMASGKSAFGYPKKHQNHLKLIEKMIEDKVPQKILELQSLEELYLLLLSYPSIGKFLAFQYAIDINYSNLTDFSEMDFVVAGPGAIDGIKKCFTDIGNYSEEDIIKWMTDRQKEEFERLEISFYDLWGRPLQLIDCQNLFCEVDKYSRVAHPELQGISKRKRIKQKYTPQTSDVNYWYPPKWGLNDRISSGTFYHYGSFRS